ncbi:MAG: hypothetical protein ACJ70T_08630 [Nitrososphaera sp.]
MQGSNGGVVSTITDSGAHRNSIVVIAENFKMADRFLNNAVD